MMHSALPTDSMARSRTIHKDKEAVGDCWYLRWVDNIHSRQNRVENDETTERKTFAWNSHEIS